MPSQPKSKTIVYGWEMPKALKKKQKAEKDKPPTSQDSPAPSSSQRPTKAGKKRGGNSSKGSRLSSNERDENSFSRDSSICDLSQPQVPATPVYSAPDNDGESDGTVNSGQQNESSSGESQEDDRPDEYEGQAYNASILDWHKMSRKHYQAFSLLQGQYSRLNKRHQQEVVTLRARKQTERLEALQDEFSRRTNGLVQSMCSTRDTADFCLIMKHYDNKDGDPEDRSFERLPLFPDQIQAAAIGTLSLNQELRSATRPYPLPPDVIKAAFAKTQRPSERIPSKAEYQDILYSQRHSMEKCLEKDLSDYLPEKLSSMISELDSPDNCGQAFPHIFDAINAHSEPWAPNYPPATLPSTRPPPRSTPSAQSGYTANTPGSRQPKYGPSSSAPPRNPRYSYSTSHDAPRQSPGSTSGYPQSSAGQSGYQSTNFPPSGGRGGTNGNSANYYSARKYKTGSED